MLLEGIPDQADAVVVAERIVEAFRVPFVIEGSEAQVTVSVGISLGFPSRNTPEVLLREADDAMYRAKRGGKAGYELMGSERGTGPHGQSEFGLSCM